MNRRGVHGVHKVRVLGDDAAVVGQGSRHNISVSDVLGADDEVVPAGRVLEVDPRNIQVCRVLGVEENRAVVLVVGVQNAGQPLASIKMGAMCATHEPIPASNSFHQRCLRTC